MIIIPDDKPALCRGWAHVRFTGNDTYTIRDNGGGFCLAAKDAATADGTVVELQICGSGYGSPAAPHQRWRLRATSAWIRYST